MKNYVILIFAVGLMALPARADDPKPGPEVPARAALDARLDAFVKPIDVAAGDSDLRKKLKERHNSAAKLLELRIADYRKGLRDVSAVFDAAHLAADSKLDLAENADQRTKVLEEGLELSKEFEAFLQKQVDGGVGSKAELERARFARLSIEVQLLKVRQKE